MPRQKQQKQKRETRKERKKEEKINDAEAKADEHLITHNLCGFPHEYGFKGCSNCKFNKYYCTGVILSEPILLVKSKYKPIFFTASPDERLEAYFEEADAIRQVVVDFQKLDCIAKFALYKTLGKLNAYTIDIELTQSRFERLAKKRKPFQGAIDHYEATIEPRPEFKILSVSFEEGTHTPLVECSEDIPRRELAYRIRQYKAYFMNQYFLYCAPKDTTKRHTSLRELLRDKNTDTREISRQMQMPEIEGFRFNYETYCKTFLESVIRKGGRDSKCTKWISVLPPLRKSQWPSNITYRDIKCYDIFGGKRAKTVYDVETVD